MAVPNLDAGQIISVALQYRVNSQVNLLTHHYHVARLEGFGNITFPEAVAELETAYMALGGLVNVIVDVWSEQVSLEFLQAQIIYPTRFAYVRTFGVVQEGTVAGAPLPQNVAAGITVRTAEAGRDQTGTKKIGGVPPTFVVGGLLTLDAVGLYEPVGAALVAPVEITNGVDTFLLTPVIYHREGGTTSSTVDNFVVHRESRVMTRRTVGRGI